MNPYERPFKQHEQSLRDEVIYLHSLWHQGPPTFDPDPNPNLYPPTYVNYSSRNLYVSNPTAFKKINRHKPNYQKAKDTNKANNVVPAGSASDPQRDPCQEWLVNSPQPSPPPSRSGWLEVKSNPSPSSRTISELDQGKVAAMHMQQKAVKSTSTYLFNKCCNQFFVKRVDLDGNGENELEEADGDEDCSGNDSVVEESEELKFLLSLFLSQILHGEPEINADGVHEGSSSPQTEIVHGNVSVSASREDSVIHHKNCVRESCKNSSSGGIVNQHVKDLEKKRIKANKLSVLDSKANLKESGGNYKKQNIAFWVNYCCWPETKLSESMRKANSLEDGRRSEGGSSCKLKEDFGAKYNFLQEQNTDGRDRSRCFSE
ncbi:hypothetical protein Peur_000693 [Populus x canadensis]